MSRCGAFLIAVLTMALPCGSTAQSARPATGARQGAGQPATSLRSLNERLTRRAVSADADLENLIASAVDIDAFADRAFGNYLERSLSSYEKVLDGDAMARLVGNYRERLRSALVRRLAEDLAGALARQGATSVTAIAGADPTRLEVRIAGTSGEPTAGLILRHTGAGARVVDLSVCGGLLSQDYRDLCADVLAERYSLAVLLARLRGTEYITLDDFSGTPAGQLPADWGIFRPKDQRKPVVCQVEETAGRTYLAARDSGSSVILGKFVHWDPRAYPVMTWCWRADALPPGGDERYNDTNDSAAGVYVVFSLNWVGMPKQLKYVWSSTLPVGEVGRRNLLGRPWFFVLESGKGSLGEWTQETVDLAEHHRTKLGGKLPDRTVSIHLLSDANSTDSYAEAYYADLRAWPREAYERGRIDDYCDCLPDDLRHERARR